MSFEFGQVVQIEELTFPLSEGTVIYMYLSKGSFDCRIQGKLRKILMVDGLLNLVTDLILTSTLRQKMLKLLRGL